MSPDAIRCDAMRHDRMVSFLGRWRPSVSEPDSEEIADALKADIVLSHRAASEVRVRGGVLYVWTRPYGQGFIAVEVATEPPADGVDFDQFSLADGIEALVSEEAVRCGRLRIEKRLLGHGLVARTKFGTRMGE